jgi:hypothetical protein
MTPKEHKISKQAAAVKTRDITLTIPETFEIIRKPGSGICHSVITAAYKIGWWTIYDKKKHKKNSPVTTSVSRGTVL